MKLISEKKALDRLAGLREGFARAIWRDFEFRAASCLTCQTPGACCLDAHFVNVRISRLEAVAIRHALDKLPNDLQKTVSNRIDNSISKYKLESSNEKFACPLFEKGSGCLVHETGKPVACTVHACYENEKDLPPDDLQFEQERNIDRLNRMTYGKSEPWLPLPIAIRKASQARE